MKNDRSPVSNGDLKVNEMITSKIKELKNKFANIKNEEGFKSSKEKEKYYKKNNEI